MRGTERLSVTERVRNYIPPEYILISLAGRGNLPEWGIRSFPRRAVNRQDTAFAVS